MTKTTFQLIHSRQDIIKKRELLLEQEKRIALVPTMGNLHQGHLNLISRALSENDAVIVSIFVNPKQFGANEDFDRYPRTLEKDCQQIKALIASSKAERAQEVIVFAPQVSDIYPQNFACEIHLKNHLAQILCAKSRPGHFDGVLTVVYQLFMLTKPACAYFGQKDLQQCFVIKQMIDDMVLDIEFKQIPVIREETGLALSSRNQYLSTEQRQQALKLSAALKMIKEAAQENINRALALKDELLSQDQCWEYLEILDINNLTPLSDKSFEIAILGAYRVGQTRLIDNIICKIGR